MWQRIDIIGSNQESSTPVANCQRYINWYQVSNYQGRNTKSLIGSPGTSLKVSAVGAARGALEMGGIPYFVIGSTLYSVSDANVATSLGTISGSRRVSMATDGFNLAIVTGVGNPGYMYSVAGGLVTITDTDFTGADSVTHQDTYFIFTDGSNWFLSDAGLPLSYSFAVASMNYAGDLPQAVISDHGETFLFGKKSCEVWYNAANIDFPFERNNSALIERGTAARHSVAKDDNTIFFIGDDRIVYRMQGYTPVRISNESIELYLSSLSETELSDAFAYVYDDHGHKFYQLTVPNGRTYVFDMQNSLWHEKKHYALKTHHMGAHVYSQGRHLIADIRPTGGVYEMSRAYFDDAGTELVAEAYTPFFSQNDRLLAWRKIKFIVESGVGNTAVPDPVLMLKWSDNGGRTFGVIRQLKLGKVGHFGQPVVKRNCGSSRNRQLHFSISDAVKRNVVEAYADLS